MRGSSSGRASVWMWRVDVAEYNGDPSLFASLRFVSPLPSQPKVSIAAAVAVSWC